MMERLLIAERGEAAVRIARACKRLGITTVGLRGPEDGDDALHLDACDESQPYTADPKALLELAATCGADAIHPGYADDAAVAIVAAAEATGVTPIAAPADAIEACRDPARLRQAAEEASVRLRPDEGLDRPRRIEAAAIADFEGSVAPLGEMELMIRPDGSVVLAEAPSPAFILSHEGEAAREAMGEAVTRLLQALGVRGLVSVGFLLDMDGRFWLDSVRPGLPLLHAPIELVAGLDLVELQLRVAAREPLDPDLFVLQPTGHAFVTRVETSQSASEPVSELRWPPGPHGRVRVDPLVQVGVRPESSLLLKVATVAPVRHVALLTLDRVLAATTVAPYETNVDELRRLLANEAFRFGQYDVEYVARVEQG